MRSHIGTHAYAMLAYFYTCFAYYYAGFAHKYEKLAYYYAYMRMRAYCTLAWKTGSYVTTCMYHSTHIDTHHRRTGAQAQL